MRTAQKLLLGMISSSGSALLPLLRELVFSRASARTNPETGAEIASGTAHTTTISEIVPTGISEIAGSDGYTYVGRFSDGRYVFNGSGGTYTSTNGEPPYSLLFAGATSRITPADTCLRFTSAEPSVVYRRPAPYTTETEVHTLERGYVAGGISGTNTYASPSMGFDANGSTLIIGEYSNTAGIKDSEDPPRYLHRSEDDGLTWAVIDPTGATPNTHCHAVFFDSVTGNWYASYGDVSPTRGIYKSTDDGETWAQAIGPTVAALYDVVPQPVSALRFGDSIVWGSDEGPSALWVHDPLTDTVTRPAVDYADSSIGITWSGVLYNLAKVGNFLIITSSQGQENYHRLWATDDLHRYWKILDMNDATTGFNSPVVRDDGSFLIKPTGDGTGNFVKVDGLTLRAHAAIATDEAVGALAETSVPLDGTGFTFASGAYIGTTGPGGLRAYKLGEVGSPYPIPTTSVAGEVLELTAWLRNPLSIPIAGLVVFQIIAQDAGDNNLLNAAKSVRADQIPVASWQRYSMRYTMPANTAKVYARVFLDGVTYNASTSYFEVAGVTMGTTPHADIETHDRAAESTTVDKAVGSAWGVYDRAFPRWDTYELTTNKTLMTLTDVSTSDYLSVVYNATAKALDITDGSTTEAGIAVRCMGSGTHYLIRDSGLPRMHYGQDDFIAYGVRRTGGTTQLVVWDRDDREIVTVNAPGSFAPSSLRITFPASGVLHVPSFASRDLTDAQVFDALFGRF